MSDISQWKTTAANNNAAAPDGWPEGMPPNKVNDSGREVQAAIRRQMESGVWFDYGHTPVWNGSATFSVSSTLTDVFTAGRAIELYGDVMGTATSLVKSSTFISGYTTITLEDSAVGSDVSQVRLSMINDQYCQNQQRQPRADTQE